MTKSRVLLAISVVLLPMCNGQILPRELPGDQGRDARNWVVEKEPATSIAASECRAEPGTGRRRSLGGCCPEEHLQREAECGCLVLQP